MKRTPLNRKTPLKKTNRKRQRARFARAYGSAENVARIQAMPCVICNRTPSEAAHVKSRGAGGTWQDLVPLCRDHHREQHTMGIDTFQSHYCVDLTRIAQTTTKDTTP